MLTYHLQLKIKNKTECLFLMCKLFVKIKHLPILSTVNLPLVEFIPSLTAVFHLPINLVLFTHSLWVQVFNNGPSKVCGRQPLKIWRDMVGFPSKFLKAVFHKFYLVHSWILCPNLDQINRQLFFLK